MQGKGFESWLKARMRCCGIDDLRIHDLRRTMDSRLLRATGNLKLVSQRLGHSDIGITARHYAHIMQDEMVDILNEASAKIAAKRDRVTKDRANRGAQ